jgi:tetratricopeptide (TPR) repeat protein
MSHDMRITGPYFPQPMFVLLRFHRWDEILKLPSPDAQLPIMLAFWHFARGSAFAAKGQITMAEDERKLLETARMQTPADLEYSFFSNKAISFLDIAVAVLDARIATAKGKSEEAIKNWESAVEIQDGLSYGEPPEWFYPIRESLGAALLQNGQADRAEFVFRADLQQYPRNPRSLFGLMKSLEAQKETASLDAIRVQFVENWKSADVTLEIGDL